MISASNSSSLWDYDDLTPRGLYDLSLYPPVIIGTLSFLILASKSISLYRRRHVQLSDEHRPLLANADAYGAVQNGTTQTNSSLKERHFDLSRLSDRNLDGTPHGMVQQVYKTGGQRFAVTLEFVLVCVQLALSVLLLFVAKMSFVPIEISIVKIVFWAYVAAIVSVRVSNLSRVNIRLPNLWIHSTAIYFFSIFPALLTFRSALIHPVNSTAHRYAIADFVISAALLWLNFTTKAGDKPAQIYVTSDGAEPSPENVSSIISFITYSWIDKIVWKAWKKPLTKDDIWGMRQDDYALNVVKSFEAYKLTLRFTYKLFVHFRLLFSIQAFWACMESMIVFAPSMLLKKILEYVEDPTSTAKSIAWTLVFLMPFCKIAASISLGCSLFLGRRVCVRMKAIIIAEVYAKALRRKVTVTEDDVEAEFEEVAENKSDGKEGKKTAELGAIINLMAIDAFKVSEICGYLHYFVSSILMICICVTLLYRLLGWPALVGSFLIIALLPLNYKIARWVASLQKRGLEITDRRIQKLNETFLSIRIIKFFAWEEQFLKSVMDIRAEELRVLTYRLMVWALGGMVWFITPTLITLISFYCYTIIDKNPLTPPIAFTSLSLFTLLRAPLDQLSDMTSFVIQSKVSLDRVSDFLDEAETSKYDQLGQPQTASTPYIGFKNASFLWNAKSESNFKLRDLDVTFKEGKLNVVIGSTGSGKSSLLLALLGEMDLLDGNVYLPGAIPRDELVVDPQTGLTESVAYCSQTPWLLNETIRNNIVFALAFNEERYDKVVQACGLARDFEILSAGDSTEVGEKGITLSGGQKQRVSLARALYSNSRHLLLDDCLSAVDSHTALWIYENCISGPLMEGRTCILVSHNVALTVQKAEWVVVMDNGRVKSQGSPLDLLDSGDLGDDDLVKLSVITLRQQSATNLETLDDKNAQMKAKADVIEKKLKAIAQDSPEDAKKTDGKLVEEESKAEGVVGMDVYLCYAKYLGGWKTWVVIFAAFLASQGVYMFQSWWLRTWSLLSKVTESLNILNVISTSKFADSTGFSKLSTANVRAFFGYSIMGSVLKANGIEHGTLFYILIYAVIGFLYAFTASSRLVIVFLCGIKASNTIFKDVMENILHARLRFFDKTPLGRIMNRFSKDIEAVDQEITPFAEGVFIFIVQCVSTLVLISLITPGFLIFAFVIVFLYYLVGTFYISLSRELKRYESITKSPIHQHFSESLSGVATIRAYGVEGRFMKQNLAAIDNNNRPFFYLWVANRWLSFRVDAVGCMVMLFAGIFVLLSVGRIDAGLAGLSLSYAISFSESALWIVRLYANVEMNMNSVERLQEYLEVEQEPPYEIKETEPEPNWPDRGVISVNDVSLRYAPELPRVIKNVTFEVELNHKVGIVGRTGAGKSTIITAFFRFLDPETGSIKIDGIDISKIGLRNLRRAITIIPQDPTLFTGTIRSNLDPFEHYSDQQIFEALRRVNLIAVGETPTDLDENQNKFFNLSSPITEGGGNLSQGERQLVCLARSLLKNPKVILLDEATSSIDYKSDAAIQQTIRDEFSNSTILTIAHRLRTIIDYDKILVMDAGRVVEYENPYVLITDKDSLFYSMCENSGELDALVHLAKEAYVKKKNQK